MKTDAEIARGLPVVLLKVADLHHALRDPSVTALGGLWEHRLDENWYLASTCGEECEVKPEGAMEVTVPPWTLAVWRHGWLVALIDPGGGVQMGHDGEIERALIGVIEAKTARLLEPELYGPLNPSEYGP